MSKKLILNDGQEYEIRPLNFKQLRANDALIKRLDDPEARKGTGYFDIVSQIVGIAMPGKPVDELLDATNCTDALYAALGLSRPKGNVISIDKANAPGEAPGQASESAAG